MIKPSSLSAILIFPALIFAGLITTAMTLGKIGFFFYIIVPSIMFEDIIGLLSFNLSGNIFINFLFLLMFWYITGLSIGKIIERIR